MLSIHTRESTLLGFGASRSAFLRKCCSLIVLFLFHHFCCYFWFLLASSRLLTSQLRNSVVFLSPLLPLLQVTNAPLVPPLVVFLAKHPLVDKFDLSSLTSLSCGAAPLARDLEIGVAKRLPNLKTSRQGLVLFYSYVTDKQNMFLKYNASRSFDSFQYSTGGAVKKLSEARANTEPISQRCCKHNQISVNCFFFNIQPELAGTTKP